MVLSKQGRIYYVVSYDGQCTVKEIDPNNDSVHTNVFAIKSKKCFGFVHEDSKRGFFYFIDEFRSVNKLKR